MLVNVAFVAVISGASATSVEKVTRSLPLASLELHQQVAPNGVGTQIV